MSSSKNLWDQLEAERLLFADALEIIGKIAFRALCQAPEANVVSISFFPTKGTFPVLTLVRNSREFCGVFLTEQAGGTAISDHWRLDNVAKKERVQAQMKIRWEAAFASRSGEGGRDATGQ